MSWCGPGGQELEGWMSQQSLSLVPPRPFYVTVGKLLRVGWETLLTLCGRTAPRLGQITQAEGLSGFRRSWQGPESTPETYAVLASWGQLWNYPVGWCMVYHSEAQRVFSRGFPEIIHNSALPHFIPLNSEDPRMLLISVP